MRNFKTCLMASVALASFGVAEANAQTFVYGGGATFPSIVYRQLFDCFAFPVDGNVNVIPGVPNSGNGVNDPSFSDNGRKLNPLAINPACPNPAGNITGLLTQFLYSPVGSGGGKRAFRNGNGSNSSSTGLGIPSSTNKVPYVSAFAQDYGYPKFHFAGSDDVVLPSDIIPYSSTASATNPVNTTRGYWLQIPALAGAVTIAHNQKDGNGVALNLAPGASLKLSRKTLCGIVSGHVTKWNNALITADNGGVVGTGQITFVHRSDGSGTSFLFSNAMVAQCAGIFGPANETTATLALYSFPWTDKTLAASQCPAIPAQGSNQHNYPDASPDQCGNAVALPPGAVFAQGSGSSGVVAQAHAINGAITYVSPDFVDPVVAIGTGPADGLPTAAIQNQYDIDNGLTAFQKPTFDKVATAMAAAFPTFDDTSRPNPLNWSRQMVVPNPVLRDAYPISGFTMLNLYQCYANADVYNGLLLYLNYYYGQQSAKDILHSQQFSEVPGVWYDEIVKLLNPDNPVTGFQLGGVQACTGRSGAL